MGSLTSENAKIIYHIMVTPFQNSVIVGSLLGDLHIQKNTSSTNRCRLRFCHSIKQKEYVNWKYSIFKDDFCGKTQPPYQTSRNEYAFYTSYLDSLSSYHTMWYQKEEKGCFKKIIPKNIEKHLIDPIALAIWYLDDGTKRNYNGCRFATQSFSLEDNEMLQSTLKTNFNFIVRIEKFQSKKTNKKAYGLYVPSKDKSYLTFKNLIYSFVKTEIPNMLYKLE